MVLSLKMLMVCVVCVAGASGTLGRCFRKCVCAVRRAVSMESEKSGPSGDYNHIEGALVCVCVCACACVGVEVRVSVCVHVCFVLVKHVVLLKKPKQLYCKFLKTNRPENPSTSLLPPFSFYLLQ